LFILVSGYFAGHRNRLNLLTTNQKVASSSLAGRTI